MNNLKTVLKLKKVTWKFSYQSLSKESEPNPTSVGPKFLQNNLLTIHFAILMIGIFSTVFKTKKQLINFHQNLDLRLLSGNNQKVLV